MQPTRHPLAPKGHMQLGVRKVSIWPDHMAMGALAEPTVWLADFPDVDRYHPRLIEKILAMEADPDFRDFFFRGGCGTKVRHIDRWGSLEADLLQRRALAMYRIVTGSETAVIDDGWASVYRHGDFCMPHSHLTATVSVVYLLDPGDELPDPIASGAPLDPFSGKFCFCDPRMRSCCQAEEGRMTNLFIPDLRAGSMLLFPSHWVHMVAAYLGERPRISLSWDITPRPLGGKPGVAGMFARGPGNL